MTNPTASAQRGLQILQDEMRRCRLCGDAGFPIRGPAVFSGPVTAQILLVGQAPAEVDIVPQGQPWSGRGGRRLMGWLADAGFEESTLRRSHYMTALTRCFPGKPPNGKGDRAPTRTEQDLCAPFLIREIALIQPKVIVPIGSMAITRFLGKCKLSDVVGEAHRPARKALQQFGADHLVDTWILPLPHPSGASLWLNTPAHQMLVEHALGKLSALKRTYGL